MLICNNSTSVLLCFTAFFCRLQSSCLSAYGWWVDPCHCSQSKTIQHPSLRICSPGRSDCLIGCIQNHILVLHLRIGFHGFKWITHLFLKTLVSLVDCSVSSMLYVAAFSWVIWISCAMRNMFSSTEEYMDYNSIQIQRAVWCGLERTQKQENLENSSHP